MVSVKQWRKFRIKFANGHITTENNKTMITSFVTHFSRLWLKLFQRAISERERGTVRLGATQMDSPNWNLLHKLKKSSKSMKTNPKIEKMNWKLDQYFCAVVTWKKSPQFNHIWGNKDTSKFDSVALVTIFCQPRKATKGIYCARSNRTVELLPAPHPLNFLEPEQCALPKWT